MSYADCIPKIKVGDIGTVLEKGLVGRLALHLISPHTQYFHFLLVAEYIPGEDDFVIIESIPSHGVAVGRLSWYKDFSVKIFRTPLTDDMHKKAIWQATRFGRLHYDYILCLKIGYWTFRACIKNFLSGKGFCASYKDYPFSKDKRVICTEVVDEAYYGLYPVFDRDYEVLPANFFNQYAEGFLEYVCGWGETHV